MADQGRSPLADMLPEAFMFFAEFKQINVAGEYRLADGTVIAPEVPPGSSSQAAFYTLGNLSARQVPGAAGFSLSQIISNQLPANDTGADWYNTALLSPTQFAWGFGAASASDTTGGTNPAGHMGGIAIVRNHPAPIRQWMRREVPWSVSVPEFGVVSTAPGPYPAWDILAYMPFPSGSLSLTGFREIERVRSFEADPVRFDLEDSLSVCLVLNGADADRLSGITPSVINGDPPNRVIVSGYAGISCKIRLPAAQTRWNQ